MSAATSIVKLETQIHSYAWGSHTHIAEMQGRPSPTEQPEAELWIGDHPNGASQVVGPDSSIPLDKWLAEHGTRALGAGRDSLPYLVKILAAARPLSVQLHPNAQQAAEGFAREEAAGLPRDDPERSYSDPNPKIEAICALGRLEALCGLRPGEEVRQLVATSRSEVAIQLLAEVSPRQSEEELAGALFRRVLELPTAAPALADQLAEEMTRYGMGESHSSPEAFWIGGMAAAFPRDRMLMAPILLNFVVVEPGDALEMPANTLHSYLSGAGVEVMTNSDNVVRCGLTPKNVALEELGRLLDGRASTPRVCRAPTQKSTVVRYPLEIGEFQISRVSVARGKSKGPGARRIKTPIGKARSVSGRTRGLIAGRTPRDRPVMRLPQHDGQNRPLQEKGRRRSSPQPSQCRRRKPWARIPQFK